MQWL
jgi:CTD small phosphatase-like protein 2